MSEIEFVEIDKVDAAWPEVAPLMLALNEYHLPLIGKTLLPDWEDRQLEHLRGAAENGPVTFILARRDGTAVAFAAALVLDDPSIFRERVGVLESMFISPDERGQGIASALLDRVEDWFRANGVHEAQLSVRVENRHARDVWARKGYETFTERRRKLL